MTFVFHSFRFITLQSIVTNAVFHCWWMFRMFSQITMALVAEVPIRPKSILRRMGNALTRAFNSSEEHQLPPNFEISEPYNFQHVRHVQLDPRTSTGFTVRWIALNQYVNSPLHCEIRSYSFTCLMWFILKYCRNDRAYRHPCVKSWKHPVSQKKKLLQILKLC